MHEFHAWVRLVRDAGDDGDAREEQAAERAAAEAVQAMLGDETWHAASYQVLPLNGGWFLVAHGFVNRRRAEADWLEELLATVVDRMPASYGMVYERDDEGVGDVDGGSWRVRTVTRGRIEEHPDPFLSPVRPRIED